MISAARDDEFTRVCSGLVSEQKEKKEKKLETTQAVKTFPTSIKEKRIPRAEAPCIRFTKRKQMKEVSGDQVGY
eukprot:1145428-Pelagomonas_calceolata.AAC.2